MRVLPMLILATAMAPVCAARLDVEVSNVRNAEGEVRLLLFDKAEGFRKEAASRAVLALPAAVGSLRAAFDGLPPGRYAVIAYHDENANGRLDLVLGMIPAEGYGLSNAPEVFGPPSFEQAAFELDETGGQVAIRLGY